MKDLKRIENVPGIYYASRDGFIYNSSLKRLKGCPCGYNYKNKNSCYLQVSFKINGKKVNKLIHRLVAETFIPNPNNYPQVNHKDGNRSNNSVDNLEWCSNIDNQKHKIFVLGLNLIGINNPASKLSEDDVRNILILLNKKTPQKKIADLYGVSQGTIFEIKHGYIWNHISGLPRKYKRNTEHVK